VGDSNLVLHQFSQAGVPLQSIGYGLQGSWYGMEFNTRIIVPEPSSVDLCVIGVLICFCIAVTRKRVDRQTPVTRVK
jgi:hypothetical protein